MGLVGRVNGRSNSTEVAGPDLRVLPQRMGAVFEDDPPGLENIAVVGHFERQIGVLFDQENGDPEFPVDLDDFRKSSARGSARCRGTARRASGTSACSSGHGRSPAFAVRRRSSVPAVCFCRSFRRGKMPKM